MKIHVVLVRTEHSSNIGSTARAMANMGVERLILVDPRCEIDASARQMAAGAQEALLNYTKYANWSDFFSAEGEGIRIALTRRAGRKRKVDALNETLEALKGAVDQHLYLVFGPEADGLDSDDLGFMNYSCHLPVFGEFASYNLGQAVLLTLFMVRSTFPPGQMPTQVTGEVETPVQPFYFPDHLIRQWIEAMGFNVGARRASAYLTLRRLFLQNRPTGHELRVLEAVLQQNIRKLNESKSLGLALEDLGNHLSDIPSQ